MKDWKHISFDQRKVINSGIAHGYKLKEIGESLGLDPTSVSKEVKRNRDATRSLTVTLFEKHDFA